MRRRTAALVLVCGALIASSASAAGAVHTSMLDAGKARWTGTGDLVRNGGFEEPAISRPWVAYFAGGERRIPGWRVVRRSVDLVGTDWPAGEGAQSLGVNGFRPGWVSQRIPTEANTTYQISFLLWGDPNGPPPVSRLAVRWNHERVRTLNIDVREQTTWRRVCVLVHSTTAGTPLGFRGLSGGNAGPAIDAVRVQPVASGH